jgi:hypothetical protein
LDITAAAQRVTTSQPVNVAQPVTTGAAQPVTVAQPNPDGVP